MSKAEEQTVWHELGHVFAHNLLKLLEYDFGELIEVSINKEKSYVRHNCDLFRFSKEELKGKRSMGLIRIKKNLSDTHRFNAYLIYMLSGAIFNLRFFNDSINEQDFKMIFTNDIDLIEEYKFIARAGKDYSMINDFKYDLEWAELLTNEYIINFSIELYAIYEKNNVFQSLSRFIKDFSAKYNGRVIFMPQINNENTKLKDFISSNSSLINNIEEFINNKSNKVINYLNIK